MHKFGFFFHNDFFVTIIELSAKKSHNFKLIKYFFQFFF
jgi:hypothetical protein